MVDSVPLKPKSMGFDIVSRANTVPRFKGFSFDRGACQGRTVSLGAGFLRLWFNVCVVFGSVVEVVSGKLNAHTGLRQRHFNQVIPNSKLSRFRERDNNRAERYVYADDRVRYPTDYAVPNSVRDPSNLIDNLPSCVRIIP